MEGDDQRQIPYNTPTRTVSMLQFARPQLPRVNIISVAGFLVSGGTIFRGHIWSTLAPPSMHHHKPASSSSTVTVRGDRRRTVERGRVAAQQNTPKVNCKARFRQIVSTSPSCYKVDGLTSYLQTVTISTVNLKLYTLDKRKHISWRRVCSTGSNLGPILLTNTFELLLPGLIGYGRC